MSVLGVVFASVVVAVPAFGTAPGQNGQIVFAHFPRLWVVNPDGTGERKFEHIMRSEDVQPDWSPDGAKIVFTRCGSARCELWTVKHDGTGFKRVGPDCLRKTSCIDRAARPGRPTRSRSHSARRHDIQNERPKDPEIYVMNANGTGVRRVTNMSAGSTPYAIDLFWPIWSPDGKQLVFEVTHFRRRPAEPPRLLHHRGRRDRAPPADAVEPERRWPPRLVARRQADPLPHDLDLEPPPRQPAHDPSRRHRPEEANQLPGAKDRPQRLLLARRKVDRVLEVHRRAISRGLPHAPRRQRPAPSDLKRRHLRPRLGPGTRVINS